jgi:phosphatidylglycerophosphate synthase
MPEPVEPALSPLEASFKTREVEGILDIYFYRRVALKIAYVAARLKMTPNGVTALGGILGIIAGHLYFYRDLKINILGMFLHVCANMLDNADGQLARILNKKSRNGRVIDSLFDHFVFVSIYIHLTLRCFFAGASPAIAILALAAGLSHALQGAAADYFRNGYLYFVRGKTRADWDSSKSLAEEYVKLRWLGEGWSKFLLWSYLNFTRQQELLSPALRRLRDTIVRQFPAGVPDSLRQQYRDAARPMLRWWGFLMTNTRMFFLFLFIAIDQPALYFWLEVSAFNMLLVGLIIWQERMSLSLLRCETAERGADAV